MRALLALASVAALLLTGCGDRDGTVIPVPGGSPSSTVAAPITPTTLTAVPEDFPLAGGLPAVNADDGSPVRATDRPAWTRVVLCGETVWSTSSPEPATDLAGASYSRGGRGRARTLAVYADRASAQRAFDALHDAYTTCREDSGIAGNVVSAVEVVADEPGAMTAVLRPLDPEHTGPSIEVVEVVTVGNALLYATWSDSTGGTRDDSATSIALSRRSIRSVQQAMTVFATATGRIDQADELSDFPLTAGWPERPGEPGEAGIVFPVEDTETDAETSLADHACGREAPVPGTAASLRGRYADIEDYRTRRLLVFDDADAAVSYVSRLSDFYAGCDQQTREGFTFPTVRVATAVGGQSFGVAMFVLYDTGGRTTGLTVQHVVRVGRSVLVDTASNEGGAAPGTHESIAKEQLDRMTAGSADAVAAQCAFTEAGC